jgi:hypothetical protein
MRNLTKRYAMVKVPQHTFDAMDEIWGELKPLGGDKGDEEVASGLDNAAQVRIILYYNSCQLPACRPGIQSEFELKPMSVADCTTRKK